MMQKEISEVLGEMQQALTAMMKSQAYASAVANARLEEVEKLLPRKEEDRAEEGKEI